MRIKDQWNEQRIYASRTFTALLLVGLLSLTLLGYSMGLARQYIVSPSPFLPVTLVAIGTFCGVVFYEVVAFLFGQLDLAMGFLLKVALLSSLYCAVLTPLVYPLIRRVWEGMTPRRRVLRF